MHWLGDLPCLVLGARGLFGSERRNALGRSRRLVVRASLSLWSSNGLGLQLATVPSCKRQAWMIDQVRCKETSFC